MPQLNFSDCTIIIRSAGERTVPALHKLLEKQVNASQIFEIREVPLAKAQEKCYETGIDDGRKWTLIIDGDILPFGNMLSELMEMFSNLDKRVFGLQCMILDKMTRTYRHAGIHMHRTSLLQDAIRLIPQEQKVMRPESVTIKRMATRGYPTLFVNDVFALHDYEQYYRDLFRKGYFLAHKTSQAIPYLKKIWSKGAGDDDDYSVLLAGLEKGEQYNGLVTSNTEYFQQFDIATILSALELREKENLDLSSLAFVQFEQVFQEFRIPAEYWNFKLFSNGNTYEVSTKRRFLQLKEKVGLLKLIPWTAGNLLEKIGRLMKQL